MRIPSRFMPRLTRRPITPLGWAVLAVLAVAGLYLLYVRPFLVGGFAVILFGSFLIMNARTKRHLARLAVARRGESIGTFARAFDPRTTDTWVVRAVYEQVQYWLRGYYPSFPLRPTDRLKEDLEFDPEDLDLDLAGEISERTGRSMDESDKNPYYGKVKTVADMVSFFCAQPRSDGKQAHEADGGRAVPGR